MKWAKCVFTGMDEIETPSQKGGKDEKGILINEVGSTRLYPGCTLWLWL